MPNANGQETQELLWQVEVEMKQIASQIASINATIKPWQVELADLRDYHKQLVDLQESLLRRAIKPRVVTAKECAPKRREKTEPKLSDAEQSFLRLMKNLSQDQLVALTNSLSTDGGESTDFLSVETAEEN